MANRETIYARISGANGAIATFRFSGPKCLEFMGKIGIDIKNIKHKEVVVKDIYYKNKFIDNILMFFMKAPNSLTGEDLLEISLHNGAYIVKFFTTAIEDLKIRIAEPGEFLKRAFLGNKMSLSKVESINSLFDAKNELDHVLASKMYSGEFDAEFKSWQEEIGDLFVILNMCIDFSEDVSDDMLSEVKPKISILLNKINTHLNKINLRKNLNEPYIAIVGEVNVGKSSIMNAIMNENTSIVSNAKGTTRDPICMSIDVGYCIVKLVDTAGFRSAKNKIEKLGIEKSIHFAKKSIFKIIVFDKSPDVLGEIVISKDDIIVLNKLDTKGREKEKLEQFLKTKYKNNALIQTSAKNKEGIDLIIKEISKKIEKIYNINSDCCGVIVTEHQASIAKEVSNLLKIAIDSSDYEVIYEYLRHASDKISMLYEKVSDEDILDNLFSRFCVGK